MGLNNTKNTKSGVTIKAVVELLNEWHTLKLVILRIFSVLHENEWNKFSNYYIECNEVHIEEVINWFRFIF